MSITGRTIVLQDGQGNNIFPETSSEAVYTSNGEILQDKINTFLSYRENADTIEVQKPEIIEKVNNIETNVNEVKTELGNSVKELTSQMEQITKKYDIQNKINIKDKIKIDDVYYSCIGDDITDDTLSLEKILKYAYDLNFIVEVPKGIYKITRPIIIDHNLSKKPSLHIIGVGNTFTTKDTTNSCVFKGYNIDAKRGILEFTGRGVNQSTGITLDYIGFEHDYDSCSNLAFNLVLGDANIPTLKKCSFNGFNNIMIRCGTAIDRTGYIFSCALFEQCYFKTNRYIDWDGVTILPKAIYGFAICPEHLFYYNNSLFIWDNVTFSECNFLGCVATYGAVYFQNCMWEIPGVYKPEIDINLFPDGILTEQTTDIGCDIGILNLGGTTYFEIPYFEDVRKCIATCKTKSNADRNIYVNKPRVNATINHKMYLNNELLDCEYFIKTLNNNYTVRNIKIEDGTYNLGNMNGFKEGFVINNLPTAKVIVDNVINVTGDMIISISSEAFTQFISYIGTPSNFRTISFKINGGDWGKNFITNGLPFIKNDNKNCYILKARLYNPNGNTGNIAFGDCTSIGEGTNQSQCVGLVRTNFTSDKVINTYSYDGIVLEWDINKYYKNNYICAFLLDNTIDDTYYLDVDLII